MMRIAGVVIVVTVCGITSSLLALNDQTGAAIVVWGAGAALVTLLAPPVRAAHGS